MSETRRPFLSRLGESIRDAVRDVALIVVSIMIAFGVDAWWSGRQEETRAAGHLSALEHEFSGLLIELSSTHGEVRRGTAATRAILAEMGVGAPTVVADSLARLLNSSFDVGLDAPPQGGALSAILSSGDIRLIADDSLAYMLAEWPLLVEELKLESALLTANREEQLRVRLIQLGVPEAAIAMHLGDWLSLSPTRFPFDPGTILRDPAIESMLVSRLIRLRILDDELQGDIARAEGILARVRGAR